MKITIIGAGNMGPGIGTPAIAGGREVEILDGFLHISIQQPLGLGFESTIKLHP